ncbi:DUF4139 domain-containing protein [Nitrosomonas sp. PY1]|uniref:DUF4139 domain-containing protein n=1 Tax=Nitrosomonas sp. PY1 TaxID=1803906 RepID=UPI001FC8B246|nr:DUF4139 domain-containing protein [Nitrosomonas sp. PY1]GKS69012.1 DUF4139 domain-containing protein [Nitrosomonas sp. PY1]
MQYYKRIESQKIKSKVASLSCVVTIILLNILIQNVSATPTSNKEITSTVSDQKNVAVTIYNEDLALVKDLRRIKLDQDFNRLAWRDVSARIRSETAMLRSLNYPTEFRLIEQNFDFDLLTPSKLLEKFIGQEIIVARINPASGAETSEMATVLATNEGVVLKYSDRIETGILGRLVFPSVPDSLRDKPTLLISLRNTLKNEHDFELSYLTSGLSWHADYVAALNEQDSILDLNGLVTLTNQSGATYRDAQLQLVAGDVHQVQPAFGRTTKIMEMSAAMSDAAPMKQESFFDYHLYTLQHPTTISENQTKQVALMSAVNVPVIKEYVLQGSDYYYFGEYNTIDQKKSVAVYVGFLNKGEGLGIPLPKGVMRVYKKDLVGNSQFVGEDRIEHTPKHELIRLKLGNAFDITANRLQTDFQQISANSPNHPGIFETAYQITIKNAKKEAVTVQVQEPMPGDWKILSETLPYEKKAANLVEWKVAVAAESEKILTYRVRIKLN